MTENMTEETTNLGRCLYGAKTETPCTRPAVEPTSSGLPESMFGGTDGVGGACAFHRSMEPMWDEVGIALETVSAWRKAAVRRDNRYLLRITGQAVEDLSERLEFLKGNLAVLSCMLSHVLVFWFEK